MLAVAKPFIYKASQRELLECAEGLSQTAFEIEIKSSNHVSANQTDAQKVEKKDAKSRNTEYSNSSA
jgi:hypothetical protein